MATAKAPWTPRIVAALREYQAKEDAHPYTCPRPHFPPGEVRLVATPHGWVCSARPACGYTQDWAHVPKSLLAHDKQEPPMSC